MNDAFNMSETEGERTYWKLLSEVIAGKFLIISEDVPGTLWWCSKVKKKKS
jgi:hypothetical protein